MVAMNNQDESTIELPKAEDGLIPVSLVGSRRIPACFRGGSTCAGGSEVVAVEAPNQAKPVRSTFITITYSISHLL
jgi:hypothetical protein